MQTRPLLIIGAISLCAALLFAQTLPSTLPLATREHQRPSPNGGQGFGWQFNLNGKKYEAKITREQIEAGPKWTPSAPLPLSLAKAEEIARDELRKLVSDDATWELTEFNLRCLNDQTEPKWYYVVKLKHKMQDRGVMPDLFILPISFSGELGRIQINGP